MGRVSILKSDTHRHFPDLHDLFTDADHPSTIFVGLGLNRSHSISGLIFLDVWVASGWLHIMGEGIQTCHNLSVITPQPSASVLKPFNVLGFGVWG